MIGFTWRKLVGFVIHLLICWFVQIERVNIRLSAINHILHHMRFQYSRGRPHFLHRAKPAGGGEGAKTEASWLLFKLQYCPHIATAGWRGHKKREVSLKLCCKKWFGCNVVLFVWPGVATFSWSASGLGCVHPFRKCKNCDWDEIVKDILATLCLCFIRRVWSSEGGIKGPGTIWQCSVKLSYDQDEGFPLIHSYIWSCQNWYWQFPQQSSHCIRWGMFWSILPQVLVVW